MLCGLHFELLYPDRYLQWLIEDQDSIDTQFHTLYALSLAKSAIESFEGEITSKILDPVRREETSISDSRLSAIFESPVRERLQIFLLSSDLYDPEEVLDLIEGSELWSEKVCHNCLWILSAILRFEPLLAEYADYVHEAKEKLIQFSFLGQPYSCLTLIML